jgi:hypothetical protein
MLSDVKLNVFMLSVVEPFVSQCFKKVPKIQLLLMQN